eukprot:CAMPEP_0175093184 /NCGR_PEP_ID=MMETSP0086_2-20121207/2869_1 /TAXON_ID=136419 /ORGANISM="Unknown Unknown, Strain D1" /LENGTH=184 /DNA_ID=CAMNT_0016366113 /DNA_START=25 /DNA_END=579 /DNA_ORIENTATION=+
MAAILRTFSRAPRSAVRGKFVRRAFSNKVPGRIYSDTPKVSYRVPAWEKYLAEVSPKLTVLNNKVAAAQSKGNLAEIEAAQAERTQLQNEMLAKREELTPNSVKKMIAELKQPLDPDNIEAWYQHDGEFEGGMPTDERNPYDLAVGNFRHKQEVEDAFREKMAAEQYEAIQFWKDNYKNKPQHV